MAIDYTKLEEKNPPYEVEYPCIVVADVPSNNDADYGFQINGKVISALRANQYMSQCIWCMASTGDIIDIFHVGSGSPTFSGPMRVYKFKMLSINA